MLSDKEFLGLLEGKDYRMEEGIVKCKVNNCPEYDLNRECYNSIAKKFKDFWEKTERWQVKERQKFVQYLPPKALVLDLGCGQGRDLETFFGLGIDNIVGVDFSIGQLKISQSRNVARLVNSNFLNMPFRDNIFNGVWSCVTLVHLSPLDVSRVLGKVNKMLKKGGIFFISMQEGTGYKIVKREIYDSIPMIMYYYTPKSVKEMLEKGGFEILDFEKFHVWKGIKDRERRFFNYYCKKI